MRTMASISMPHDEMFRILAEESPSMIFINIGGKVVYANRLCEETMGYAREEFYADSFNFIDLVAPEYRDAIVENFRIHLSGSDVPPFEYELVKKNGERIHSIINTRLFDYGDGRAILGIITDISGRKKAEQALRKSEELYREIVSAIEDGITITENGHVVYISDQACEIFGIDRESCIDKTVFDFAAPEENEKLMKVRDAIASGEMAITEQEFWIVRGDGTRRYIRNHYVALDRESNRWLVTTTDITRYREAEDSIRASLVEKEILLKEIHHRVKNNMQVISSILGLQSQYLYDPRDVDLITDCQNRVRAMAMVHEKLYQTGDLSSINIEEYIRTLSATLLGFYPSAGVSIAVSAGSLHLDVSTAITCAQIINELLSNSLKYAFPDGMQGAITVGLREVSGGMIELIYADNGVGLPAAVDPQTTRSLGLRLVEALAKGLGGALTINRDHGTSYIIILPQKK